MTIKKASLLISSLTLFAVISTAALLYLLTQRIAEVDQAAADRFYSNMLTDELRESSQELTSQVRIFAATGSSSAEEAYNMVLAVRSGQEPRPEDSYVAPGQKRALLELLREYGITDDEFRLVEESNALSNALVALEVRAMNAVKGIFMDDWGEYTIYGEPDRELALSLVFSGDYFEEVEKIMAPMEEFQSRVYHRTQKAIEETSAQQLTAEIISIAALAVVFILAVFNIAFSQVFIVRPLFTMNKTLQDS
jgi:hypothetical protein